MTLNAHFKKRQSQPFQLNAIYCARNDFILFPQRVRYKMALSVWTVDSDRFNATLCLKTPNQLISRCGCVRCCLRICKRALNSQEHVTLEMINWNVCWTMDRLKPNFIWMRSNFCGFLFMECSLQSPNETINRHWIVYLKLYIIFNISFNVFIVTSSQEFEQIAILIHILRSIALEMHAH